MTMRGLLLLLLGFLTVPALAQTQIIAEQPNAPFAIKQFVAGPSSAITSGRRAGGGTPDRIVHMVEGYNATGQTIEAVEITFVSFDPFGAVLAVTTEMDVAQIGQKAEGQVTATSMTSDADTYHTGVAYVRQVRLADGTLWEAPLNPVMKALRQVDSDFNPALLDD